MDLGDGWVAVAWIEGPIQECPIGRAEAVLTTVFNDGAVGHDDPVEIPLQHNLQGPGQGVPVGGGQPLENRGLQAIETAADSRHPAGEQDAEASKWKALSVKMRVLLGVWQNDTSCSGDGPVGPKVRSPVRLHSNRSGHGEGASALSR